MSYTRILRNGLLIAAAGLTVNSFFQNQKTESKTETQNINKVDDIVFNIFCCLSAKDTANLSLVCKLWNEISKDEGLWDDFIAQEKNKNALVIAKPSEMTNKLFYKLNLEALKATKEKLLSQYSDFFTPPGEVPSKSDIQFKRYFSNILKEENFVIPYHKGLIEESFIGILITQLYFKYSALAWHDGVLYSFRGCARKLLEDGIINSNELLQIFYKFLFKKNPEPQKMKHLFSQYNLAKLVCTDRQNLDIYNSIPISTLENVNDANFKIVLTLIQEGMQPKNAVEHVFPYPANPLRNICAIF